MAAISSLLSQAASAALPCDTGCAIPAALSRNRELSLLYTTHGITYQNELGETILHIASAMGDEAWGSFLMSKGCDPLARSECGNTPLHSAARENHPTIIHTLLAEIKRAGGTVDVKNFVDISPLQIGVINNSKEAVEALLAEGADLSQMDAEGLSLLNLAITCKATAVALLLIENWLDINATDSSENTPLHYAATYGEAAVASVLLAMGACLSMNSEGLNQTHLAAICGATDVLEVFRRAGLNLNEITPYGKSPIYLAAENGREDTCKYLIEQGVEIRIAEKYNLPSLLMLVIEKNLTSFASVLIPLKFELTKPTAQGYIPLQYALGNSHIAKLLMRYGGVPEACKEGVLCTIIDSDNLELLKIAFACAPDLWNTVFRDGQTVYSLAYFMQKKRILSYLGSPDKYSRFVIEAKLLSGVSGIPGTLRAAGQNVVLERAHSHFFYLHGSEVLGHEHPSLQAAFAQASLGQRSAQEIHDSIASGALTVIPAGWLEHSITIVIQGDMMIICNRGTKRAKVGSMQAYAIDPRKISVRCIEAILEKRIMQFSAAEPFFYTTLPWLLSSTETDTAAKQEAIQKELNTILPKNQRSANCSAASMKTAIRAALFIEMYRRDPASFSAIDAKALSKRICAKLRERAEERCRLLALELPIFSAPLTWLITASTAKRLHASTEARS